MNFNGPWTRLLWLGVWLGVCWVTHAAQTIGVSSRDTNGWVSFDEKTHLIQATNGVIVRYTNAVLQAERAQIDQESGEVVAEGDVILEQGTRVWRGSHVEYNFRTEVIRADTFRVGQAPLFTAAQGLKGDHSNHIYSATNAFVTTDDLAEPYYRVRLREITLVPGEYIEGRGAVLYLGKTPVMYYPYYHRSLRRHPNNFVFTPGYRSLFGAYLLGTYNYYWDEKLNMALHFDLMQRRGVGVGPDFEWDMGKLGEGHFKSYFIHDEDAGISTTNHVPIRENRFRVSFDQQADLTTNLSAKLVLRDQSDALFIRDFFEGEYRRNTQPSSFLELNQHWDNFSLNVLAQPQINDFFQTVERLPDIRLTGLRQQIGATPLFYDSESSLAYLHVRSPFAGVLNYAGTRADTYQQIVLPRTFFGFLNVTPRVGGRFTYYGEADGAGTPTAEQSRWVFNTGVETSFKLSKVWDGAENKLLDVHGLRHILEPSVNYVFVPSPNKLPNQLPQYDTELPSLRLLPIEYPDYNSIDSIDSQNVLRLSLRNKLQTKRTNEVSTLLNWGVYTDWRLRTRPNQTSFSDIYSDLDFMPRSWIVFNSLVRYDVDSGHWRESYHTITLLPNDKWSWSLGHRYLRDDPTFVPATGNNTITSRLFYKINENWGVRFSHLFEAHNGLMEEQYYSIYRDLRSWTSALTFRVRENSLKQKDYAVALQLSLKAFPRYKLHHDVNEPSYLLGN